jgi:hypothetical protein
VTGWKCGKDTRNKEFMQNFDVRTARKTSFKTDNNTEGGIEADEGK